MGRQITSYFNEDELRCKCGCGEMKFSDRAVGKLQLLRLFFGAPIHINSGYRCPKYNNEVSSTGLDGPHTVFKDDNITVDTRVNGKDVHRLFEVLDYSIFTGIGVKQIGEHSSRFIHLDCLVNELRPWVWGY